MKEHWHNVYVTETVSEVVNSLRSCGIKVDYNPKPEDPEDANGCIEQDGGIISSCVHWRASEAALIKVTSGKISSFLASIPKEAMVHIQLLSSAENFITLRTTIENNLTIVKNCQNC